MNCELRITLKSDMCSASGDGFSLSIDTDVSYDSHGLPVIPSRRIKGCMLESAKYIGAQNIGGIFGVSGTSRGSLRIGNAVPEGYASLCTEAENSGKNAQQILALFTSVKASTAIEDDTAKNESLRFMRAVNHYSPFDGSEMVFTAPIEIEDKYFDELSRICRAVRNIGYKRTRGFGAVRCELLRSEQSCVSTISGKITDDEATYELRYSVRNESALMLPGSNSSETDDYISGTSIMGFFANQYLKNHSDDSNFEEMFLRHGVIFSNLYITSPEGTAALPAPAAIAKDKTQSAEHGTVYENLLTVGENHVRILKPLKSGYFATGKEVKVQTETVYHHSTGDDSTLYTQTCICPGQVFSGTVTGKGKYLRNIAEALSGGVVTVGRSKTAQYAECSVLYAELRPLEQKQISVSGGERIAAVFCSDALFTDDCGSYTTDFAEVCCQLGIKNADTDKSFMKYKTIMGYMSAGNYKKPHIRAIAAGSTICFTAESDCTLPEYAYFGAKNGEGFGMVRFVKADELMKLGESVSASGKVNAETDGRLTELLKKNDTTEEMRSSAIDYSLSNRSALVGLSSSFVGRVLLMIRQAGDFNDLIKRIDSVKTEAKKKKAHDIAMTAEKYKYNEDWREYLETVFLLGKYFLRTADRKEEE